MSKEMKMKTFAGCSQPRTITYRVFCMALLVFGSDVFTAQRENHPVRNIVLVHGAWADGSGWRGVYDILTKDGYNVSIVQEPETSFKDDVEATKRVIAQQDGPCILVAHSYGDAVATEAGNHPSVVGLVYVAAHMPDAGESGAAVGKRFPSDLSKSTAINKRKRASLFLLPPKPTTIVRATFPAMKPHSWDDHKC